MNYRTKRYIPIIAMLFIFAFATMAVVKSDAEDRKQPLPAGLGNLSEARLVEVKDANGKAVLSGNFAAAKAGKREIERSALLAPTGLDADAQGLADLEISKHKTPVKQEIELTVKQLAPATTYRLIIDGHEVASFNTNSRGEAELEVE